MQSGRSPSHEAVVGPILEGQYAGRDSLRSLKQCRILNWNIERGQDLAGVIEFVRRERPDICIFQEVDLYARRTGRQNVADVLATQSEFNYVFGVEFEELSQASKLNQAFTGQAVLARCPITAPRILRFERQSDVWRPRWFLPRWPVFQPRRGGRMALVAELVFGRTRLVVYDLHLESQADDALRLSQLNEVIEDAVRYTPDTPIVIAGDLNTRITPSPLPDSLRAAGFQDACESTDCRGTKPTGKTLDWIFTRGPAVCSNTKVHRDTRASDHYPVSTNLALTN